MLKLLEFDIFKNQAGITHFVTTRDGGISERMYQSLNLSLKAGDTEEHVLGNRFLLSAELKLPADNLLFPDQCHTDRVGVIDGLVSQDDLYETDALVTNQKGIGICVLAADCVPILLYDKCKKIIAAVHAGWKGTVKQIILRTVEQMIKNYSSDPKHILAGIGPAISQDKFEVGDEVSSSFTALFSDQPNLITKNSVTGKDHIDLQGANKILLLRAGLIEEHIEIMNRCTFSNPELFFSARRDGFASGRFASGILLK